VVGPPAEAVTLGASTGKTFGRAQTSGRRDQPEVGW